MKSIRKVFIQFNINEGPTEDPRVRRALNHAVDVESIIRTLFRGRAYGRDKGMILEGFEGYQGANLQPFKYDPELAKKLLAEAGYPNGFETTLWHPIGRYMLDKEASQAIAGQLAQVGVKAKLEGMETGAYFAKMSKEKVPGMNFFACGPLYMNPIFCSLVHHQPGAAFAYGADERTAQFIKSYTETLDERQAGEGGPGFRALRLRRAGVLDLALAPAGHLRSQQQGQLEAALRRADDVRGGLVQVGLRVPGGVAGLRVAPPVAARRRHPVPGDERLS